VHDGDEGRRREKGIQMEKRSKKKGLNRKKALDDLYTRPGGDTLRPERRKKKRPMPKKKRRRTYPLRRRASGAIDICGRKEMEEKKRLSSCKEEGVCAATGGENVQRARRLLNRKDYTREEKRRDGSVTSSRKRTKSLVARGGERTRRERGEGIIFNEEGRRTCTVVGEKSV